MRKAGVVTCTVWDILLHQCFLYTAESPVFSLGFFPYRLNLSALHLDQFSQLTRDSSKFLSARIVYKVDDGEAPRPGSCVSSPRLYRDF